MYSDASSLWTTTAIQRTRSRCCSNHTRTKSDSADGLKAVATEWLPDVVVLDIPPND